MYQNLQSADEAQRLEALRQQKAMRNDLMFQSAPDFRRPTEKDTGVKDAEAEKIIRELETIHTRALVRLAFFVLPHTQLILLL